MNRKTFIKKSM